MVMFGNLNGKPVGVIQVIHGMTEYIGRYEEFAAHFTDLGYVVCGFDLEKSWKIYPYSS